MFVTRYSPKSDNWNIMRILKKREKDPKLANDLPSTGFVVFEEDHMVAAGFLRKCEGSYAIFDSYITDPAIAPKLRDQALEIIMVKLIDEAKSLNIKHLIGFSVDNNTILRSQRHGFVLNEHKLLTRVLF